MSYTQDDQWRFCQVCGLGRSATGVSDDGWTDDDWFMSPSKDDPNLTIVRCPQHVTGHALRSSVAGRTRSNVLRSILARDRPAPTHPAGADPFPMRTTKRQP